MRKTKMMNNYTEDKIARKNKKNSFQHFNSSNGFTLKSVTIGIIIVLVILAFTLRLMTYYTNSIQEVADTTFETEFEKFNLYMLQETNMSDNSISELSDNKITFENGNTIEYRKEDNSETGEVFYNDIKICDDVDTCLFSKTDNLEIGQTTIVVDITISGVRKRNKIYTMHIENSRLPKDYQEVEYIESTGTQYIDTGIIGKSGISMNCEISFTEFPTTYTPVFGSYGSSNSFYLLSYAPGNYLAAKGRDAMVSSYAIALDTKYDVNVNMKSGDLSISVNGETIATDNNVAQINTQNTIFLFGYNFNGKYDTRFPVCIKLYSFKLYDNDSLVRDFVPCYNKSTGDIGLYDLVSNEFFKKAGTTEFLKGEDVKG